MHTTGSLTGALTRDPGQDDGSVPMAASTGGTPVGRRNVLRLAAAGVAAGLTGCSAAPSMTSRASTTAAVASAGSSLGPAATTAGATSSTASATAWAALKAQLTGPLLRPGDSGYEVYRLAANPRYDGVHPAAVARCANAADVAACIRFARESGVSFTVRSGGHSYGGWSTGTGLVVDLSAMSGGQVNATSGQARIAAGTRLVDVYRRVAAAGRGIPAGSCPSVGLAGLTLGGGIGVLSRTWGLTCDAVVGYDLVDATGTLRQVSAQSEPDLFWAGRGGGGGSFGVVTSFTLGTRAAPTVTMWSLHWPWHAAADVVQAWQAWAPTADRRLWSTCKLLTTPSTPRVLVAGTWTGPPSGLNALLKPILDGAGVATTSRGSLAHSYLDAMLLEAGCGTEASCHLPPVGHLTRENEAATSHLPTTSLPAVGVRELVRRVESAAAVGGLTEGGVSLDALGGAVTDVAPSGSAFAHRRSPFSVQYTATWAGSRSAATYDTLVRSMRTAMTPWFGDTAYVNYPDAALPHWQTAYWGASRARLEGIKRTVDPDDVFHFAQSVGR